MFEKYLFVAFGLIICSSIPTQQFQDEVSYWEIKFLNKTKNLSRVQREGYEDFFTISNVDYLVKQANVKLKTIFKFYAVKGFFLIAVFSC